MNDDQISIDSLSVWLSEVCHDDDDYQCCCVLTGKWILTFIQLLTITYPIPLLCITSMSEDTGAVFQPSLVTDAYATWYSRRSPCVFNMSPSLRLYLFSHFRMVCIQTSQSQSYHDVEFLPRAAEQIMITATFVAGSLEFRHGRGIRSLFHPITYHDWVMCHLFFVQLSAILTRLSFWSFNIVNIM